MEQTWSPRPGEHTLTAISYRYSGSTCSGRGATRGPIACVGTWSRAHSDRGRGAPCVWRGLTSSSRGWTRSRFCRRSRAFACYWVDGLTLRWAWPSIAFLSFMVPLPYRAEAVLGAPLQRLATLSSTYVLQLFGLPAFSSGNTIVIDDYTIGIVDACNGLGAAYTVLACARRCRPFSRASLARQCRTNLFSCDPNSLVTNADAK